MAIQNIKDLPKYDKGVINLINSIFGVVQKSIDEEEEYDMFY
mgnify:CR=1 FL=1